MSGCVWGTRRSQKVTLLVALNFCAPLRHAMADACTDPCSCTLLRSHPAACDTRPRALYRPWRTQHRSHDKRLSVRRPAPGHRRRGRDCRHALPSPHVVARRRRRPVAGSSCRLRLLTRQRSWRRRGSAGGGVSAVDTLHERAQHAAPAGTAAGRSVEGRPRMHECYTRECGVNAASRPAPRGARALPAPSRQRAAPSCVRANRPDSATWRPLVLLRGAPQLAVPCSTTWKHAHGISGLSSGATTGRTCS